MIVRNLRLRNFRNYEKTEIVLNSGMNLITGENAQGKTNLLESLVVLSLTRSHRISSDRQMIRHGTEFAEIGCIFEDGSTEKRIDVIIHPEGKTLLVKRQPVKRSSEFIGLLNVILFSPDDMGIFTDAPRERRKMLNQEITKVSPGYLNALSGYQNLLKNRNILLKQENPDIRYLDVLDEQMIGLSVKIIQERRRFVSYINSRMPEYYRSISGSDLEGNIRYLSVVNDEEDIEGQLRDLYMNMRLRDLENHVTGNGVHREDIEFDLDGMNVILAASQGQKRMVLLSFKLALMKFAEELSGKTPVLLLDDVLSELDPVRQQRLIRMIYGKCQCIITSAEYPSFLDHHDIKEFFVQNGSIVNKSEGGLL